MVKIKTINRKTTRKIKKTGIALAVSLAMIFSAVPIANITTYAATESATYVAEATTTFTFTDADISSSVESEDYTIVGTDLTIKSSGTYILTGSCSEGSVTVKKGVTNVTLVLQNFDLASTSGAPITINKNNTDTTIVISGTNTLTNNENPDDEESTNTEIAEAFEGAGIKIKSSGTLLITGDGTLNVNGNCKNGIKGADNSTITIGDDSDDTFTLNVTASSDGISGDGADGVAGLNIIGGNINVSAGDDAIKSDYILNIGQSGTEEGATINVTNCTEGLEGATVNLYGGNATIVSSDDGINAANSDFTDYSFSLNIYGGNWDIDAGGDGIDSNGTITVSGGVTDVSSSTQNDNNAIDWGDNSAITVTGGTIIGIGMGGMQEGFTNGNYVMFSANLSKGNVISITDNSGNVLYTTTVKKSANSVIFSNDNLVDGAAYTLKVNGSTVATATEGVAQNGMQPGGMQPGGMQPGGMQPGGSQPGGFRSDGDFGEKTGNTFQKNAETVISVNSDGEKFTSDSNGDIRCYNSDGTQVVNDFKCDGTYTYYFQADGTAMKDRLTYHPDGVHVIYFDDQGHEVFSKFAHVKKAIAGNDVDDFCFFDVYGHLYVDVLTYDQAGQRIYYANPYGVMEVNKWFQFSDNVKWADGTPADANKNQFGFANYDGTLATNSWTYDFLGRWCYLQGNGVAIY